eukprot:50280-Eustigmatos_ZCMA.PRE.1
MTTRWRSCQDSYSMLMTSSWCAWWRWRSWCLRLVMEESPPPSAVGCWFSSLFVDVTNCSKPNDQEQPDFGCYAHYVV